MLFVRPTFPGSQGLVTVVPRGPQCICFLSCDSNPQPCRRASDGANQLKFHAFEVNLAVALIAIANGTYLAGDL
jgi:hypothetical protein